MVGAKRQKRMQTVQLIFICFLLFLLIFMLGSESARVAAEVTTETLRVERFVRTVSGGGYFFLDETVLADRNRGPVEYTVVDGERIAAGDTPARVYRDDTGTDKRERAARCFAEIELLEAALSGTGDAWQLSYLLSYAALNESASLGIVSDESNTDALTFALLKKQVSADPEAARARIAVLRAEIAALVEYVGEPNEVYAAREGVFYRNADGLEAVFTPEAARELTPDSLRELARTEVDPNTMELLPVGKTVHDGSGFFAVTVKAEDGAFFEVGTAYSLLFEDENVNAEMRLAKKTASADETEVLLLFESEKLPQFYRFLRYRRVQIAGEASVALSVPETAMRVENNRDGVYILKDGVAAWRPVEVAVRADGCCLVTGVGETELAEGDLLIVTARRLYEGKVIESYE